ncbi:MAG TPA: trypsin-like peptidase domain-containing protein [Solirubrobacteraceae bacterium]|jgi:putative serine protease PepD|nr:trypsin-like peptidase domain-containing protein [Solirubrobacteraceae bacterium]
MSNEPSDGPEPGSGRLWTDPREGQEHTPWLEPRRRIVPRAATPTASTGSPPPARRPDEHEPADRSVLRRRRMVGIVVGTLVAALLIAAGVLGASLLRDDASPSASLPVIPGAAPADQRSRSIRAIYAAVKDSVVPVRVRGATSEGSGTGFVIDRGGVIVTNAHVVKDAQQVQVRLTDKGGYIDADVVGADVSSDLAVLHVDSSSAAKLRPLPLADSDKVQVGDATLAIGYPLGINRSASASSGIVSGLGRSIDAANNFSIDKVIQTDAAINPGNSGGPLLDAAGRVIGVNTAILTAGGGGSVGIGFAVPSNTMRRVVPRLERGRTVRHAYLGVQTREFQSGPGAYVAGVSPGTPADHAGLQVGDVVVGVDGTSVTIPEDISAAIQNRQPGDSVSVEVQRAGARKSLQATLGVRPESASGATLTAPTTP